MVSLLVYHLELIKFRWSTQWFNIKSNHISSCKFSIYFAKKYFFYFIYPLLQNTHISLSILHIYSIKYSFFFTFFIISFPLEQTHKLVFSVEPHPHPHPSFNKITHTQPAIVFSVELQTQHKPKITHTQPPTTINDQIEQTHQNHPRSLSQGLGSLDHGPLRKSILFMWSEMREAERNHGLSFSWSVGITVVFDQGGWLDCWIREADWHWERVDRREWGEKGNEKKRVRWVRGRERREKKKNTTSVPVCLSSILFWDVPKSCHVSKNKLLVY